MTAFMTYKEECESLRQQLAESEAERMEQARLLGMSGEREAGLLAKLAAAQAREQQLREALEDCVSDSHAALDYMREAYGDRLISEQNLQADVCKKADEAIAIHADTSALEAMIARAGEVMRERCIGTGRSNGLHIEGSKKIRSIPGVTLEDLK